MKIFSELDDNITKLEKKLKSWDSVPLDVCLTQGKKQQATLEFMNYSQSEIEAFFGSYIISTVKEAFLGVQVSGVNKDTYKKVLFKDILYFEAIGDKLFAYTKKEAFLIKNKLYEVEEISPSFVRINKSNVVNVLAVDKISPSLNSHLILWLTDGQDLEVSRKYKKIFLNYLEEK